VAESNTSAWKNFRLQNRSTDSTQTSSGNEQAARSEAATPEPSTAFFQSGAIFEGTLKLSGDFRVESEFKGKIITDGYQGYSGLKRAGPDGEASKIDLVNCWSHARRKFVDCENDYPLECKAAIDMIRKLYRVDAQVSDPWKLPEDEREEAFSLLGRLRDEQSKPITVAIKEWAMKQLSLPQSTFRRAIEYLLGHWNGLTKFLDDPQIPLDTNQIERGFRGPVVGRKNHYGSKSERGTEVAAIFYSLIESAKLAGVNPQEYLFAAANAALENPGSALLPHELR
jgi:transposase